MTATHIIVAMVATSGVLRLVLGHRHPLALVALIIGSAVGFADARGTNWQWAWLITAATMTALFIWLVVEWRRQRPSPA